MSVSIFCSQQSTHNPHGISGCPGHAYWLWSHSLTDYIGGGGTFNLTCCWREANYWDHQGSYALSMLHLTSHFYHIFSNISRSSFSLSYASCFLQRVLPVTKHLCMTCDQRNSWQKESFDYNLRISFSCVLYQSHHIYLPLKLGITPALLRWAYVLCWLCWGFKLSLTSIHSRRSMFYT